MEKGKLKESTGKAYIVIFHFRKTEKRTDNLESLLTDRWRRFVGQHRI